MTEFTRPNKEPDLEVVVTLHPTEAGGRKAGLPSTSRFWPTRGIERWNV